MGYDIYETLDGKKIKVKHGTKKNPRAVADDINRRIYIGATQGCVRFSSLNHRPAPTDRTPTAAPQCSEARRPDDVPQTVRANRLRRLFYALFGRRD